MANAGFTQAEAVMRSGIQVADTQGQGATEALLRLGIAHGLIKIPNVSRAKPQEAGFQPGASQGTQLLGPGSQSLCDRNTRPGKRSFRHRQTSFFIIKNIIADKKHNSTLKLTQITYGYLDSKPVNRVLRPTKNGREPF